MPTVAPVARDMAAMTNTMPPPTTTAPAPTTMSEIWRSTSLKYFRRRIRSVKIDFSALPEKVKKDPIAPNPSTGRLNPAWNAFTRDRPFGVAVMLAIVRQAYSWGG
jgi:hypothetical protein